MTPLTQRALDEAHDRDNFVNQVRMVSNRSEGAAIRLEKRIRALAIRQTISNTESAIVRAAALRRTWMQRYCEGWAYRFNRARPISVEERDRWSGTIETVSKSFQLPASEAQSLVEDLIRQLSPKEPKA